MVYYHKPLKQDHIFFFSPDIKQDYKKGFIYIRYIFYNCHSIESIPDISKWDLTNVHDLSYMFYGCSSLKSLPDISK